MIAGPDLLLDTSVLVDVGRKLGQSLEWFQSIRHQVIGIPVLVWMELVDGCRTGAEVARLKKELNPLPVVHLTAEDSALGLALFERFRLSHGTEIIDALIGATAARLALPLYTLNLKHFRPLPGVDARKPY
ncbi:MAG: type II toxin-antitoxin system VapC family toxin [Nitrospirae bacterium]|nr:type II toxin-antitoxin system VapC family toxin [Nitrospirota bacterium]